MSEPRAALEEDRDFLLRSLEDLEREREAGDLDEADYLTLKDDYTARAAAVLRALAAAGGHGAAGEPGTPEDDDGEMAGARGAVDGGGAPGRDDAAAGEAGPVKDGPRPGRQAVGSTGAPGREAVGSAGSAGAPRRRRGWRPLAVGAGLLVFASAAGLLVARSAGERLPGDAATGEITATGPAAGIAADLAAARELIGEGRTLDAIKTYDRVLGTDPEQPEALAYRGWLLRLAGRAADDTGLVDKGMEYIERAVAADPGYPDARFFRAFVNYQDRRDPAAAVPDLRAYLAADEAPQEMRPVVEDLLRRALADAEAGAPGDPAPVGSPTSTPG